MGEPERVNVHDFPDKELGKAIPYGIYDVSDNTGWVTVGTDHDTSAFAVATLRSWWRTRGRVRYPGADRLLICADGGGSNGSRVRAWKIELAGFAADTGLPVTVRHLPPGTSKWNKIEPRPLRATLGVPAEDPPDHAWPRLTRARPHRARHLGHRCVPHRHHLHRSPSRCATPATARLPRRLELPPAPAPQHADANMSYFVMRATVRSDTGWPAAASAAASFLVDFVVQTNSDIGSPRVCGSTNALSCAASSGSVSVSFLRPPPAGAPAPAAAHACPARPCPDAPRWPQPPPSHHPTPTRRPRCPAAVGAAASAPGELFTSRGRGSASAAGSRCSPVRRSPGPSVAVP